MTEQMRAVIDHIEAALSVAKGGSIKQTEQELRQALAHLEEVRVSAGLAVRAEGAVKVVGVINSYGCE